MMRPIVVDIRNPDKHDQIKMSLECHAFICRGQADAIAIAAQLYQALVETIRRNNAEISNGKNSCRVSFLCLLHLLTPISFQSTLLNGENEIYRTSFLIPSRREPIHVSILVQNVGI